MTDVDVFVSGHRKGLYRVERATGRPNWLNEQADRFLSTNQKFVYALDRSGALLVLDYARGTTLAQYDVRDWLVPVPNELTDRFYLASHDGQILCLRNRSDKLPRYNKTFEVRLPPKTEEKKDDKAEPKDLEKDNKDNEKKDATLQGAAHEVSGITAGTARTAYSVPGSRRSSGSSTAVPSAALRATASVNSMYATPLSKSVNVTGVPRRMASTKSASTRHCRA